PVLGNKTRTNCDLFPKPRKVFKTVQVCHNWRMEEQNVVLTGFMGTGKSTVGRLLAVQLGCAFVDTDELIVARDGRSIADIFREDGETAFRNWEARIAQELAGQSGLVIATGGRLMLDEGNAAALGENGRVFCLTAIPETILARLQNDGGRRPLLDVPEPARQIARVLAERR
ncbi:MAG: shikimate kinase, partial [Anaerolineae bacterium]